MTRFAIYLLAIGLITFPVAGAPAPKPTKQDLIKAELANLEGTWKIVYYQIDGQEASAEVVAGMSPVTFKGYDYSFASGTKGKITFIDPTTTPKLIDYKNGGSDDELNGQAAIYKLEGDTFRDCITYGDDRPKAFSAKEGSRHILIKYERVKEAKK